MRTAAWIWIGLVVAATVVGTILAIVQYIRDDPEGAVNCGIMMGMVLALVLTVAAIVIVTGGG